MVAGRFEVPEGWGVQAFQFALDCTPGQAACVRRQFGARRYARNWAVGTLEADIDVYQATGAQTDKPSFFGMGPGGIKPNTPSASILTPVPVVARDQQGGIR